MKPIGSTAGALPALRPLASQRRQPVLVALAVLLAHAGLLVYVQSQPAAVPPPEPPVVMMELLPGSPAPVAVSRPASQPEPRKSMPPTPHPTPNPAPRPVAKPEPAAVAQPEPSPLPSPPSSPAPSVAPASTSSSAAAAPAVAASGPAHTTNTAPAPAKVELPSASAAYLDNPKPTYPPLSRRLREEGKVVLRVLIETDGSASQAEIRSSSGYERLDQAALHTVLKWRYVPAKRNGVPEAMWFNVPINFVLE